MTIGVGISNAENELLKMVDSTTQIQSITESEYKARIKNALLFMKESEIEALYLHSGSNLQYFTGIRWKPSERMVGALLTCNGSIHYILPTFELGTFKETVILNGEFHLWDEHESPFPLLSIILKSESIHSGRIALDESIPFLVAEEICDNNPSYKFSNSKRITSRCRMQKSAAEIAILQHAKKITLRIQKAAAAILREGISTEEVVAFIDAAHIAHGIPSGSYFCIVLFGSDTQYPHGVKNPKPLEYGDTVLIDTGCELKGYISDITRTYVFGTPTDRQREVWNHEKQAQLTAFKTAKIGTPCSEVDAAVRRNLEEAGYGPNYDLPGLPHRTGHGTGLDIHESPYLVGNDSTRLATGMVLSNEPMICIPEEFGIRHEDHFYMTENGPVWLTEPMASIDDPFKNVE